MDGALNETGAIIKEAHCMKAQWETAIYDQDLNLELFEL